jgi:hypothetical protein
MHERSPGSSAHRNTDFMDFVRSLRRLKCQQSGLRLNNCDNEDQRRPEKDF